MSLFSRGYTIFKGASKPTSSGLGKVLSNFVVNQGGYRKLGLRADDLIPEEDLVVQQALRRLSPKETFDRQFRIRRGFQLSLSHQLLPPHEQLKPEEDIAYLSPLIAEIEAEIAEREHLDSVIVERRKK